MNELVSIIIPVYNQELYIKACLDSVINQTYKNIEIIVINDGSTDNSLNILKEYKKIDKRIILINQKNQGVYKARCNGIKKANGKYITFLDSDDFIDLDFVEKLLKSAINDKADIVRCNFKYYKDNKFINNSSKLKSGLFRKKEYEDNIYKYIYTSFDLNSVCMQLIKKEIAVNATEKQYELKYGEDLVFNCLMIENTKSIKIISDCLYSYRTNNNSYSKTKSIDVVKNRIDDILKYTSILDDFISVWNINEKDLFKQYLCHTMLKNIIYQIKQVNNKQELFDIISIIYDDVIYKKISIFNPKGCNNLKDKIMIHIEKNIIKKDKFKIYIDYLITKKFL